MFNVIRLPTKFSRTIKRFSQKEKSELLDMLINIGDGETINIPDTLVGDTVGLIYGEWMNMESKNGNKPKSSLIQYSSESVAQVTPSESTSRVEESRLEENKIENISKDITTEVVEKPTYGNEEINSTLEFLQKAVGIDEFKESKKRQRVYGKHFVGYINKQGKEDFIERLKGVLADDFKSKNCNSIKYLYNEVKSYIYNPVIQEERKIKSY